VGVSQDECSEEMEKTKRVSTKVLRTKVSVRLEMSWYDISSVRLKRELSRSRCIQCTEYVRTQNKDKKKKKRKTKKKKKNHTTPTV